MPQTPLIGSVAFVYEVEFLLGEGNSLIEKEGKHLRLNKDQKHNIQECVAAEMYKYKVCLSVKQFKKAAKAFLTKYPCLREKGSGTGYNGWKNFKMGNYRTKLCRAGIKEVSINVGKCSQSSTWAAPSRSDIKRPRRGEIIFLPNYPSGETKDTLESQRNDLVNEFQKVSAE